MSITIKDVAKEAGVSVATVSRVLNGSCNVSDESTKKVNETIARLNYSPNFLSRRIFWEEILESAKRMLFL